MAIDVDVRETHMARKATPQDARPEPLATPREVAELLGVPEHSLAQWRSRGQGPAYVKVERHVRYRWDAVTAYLEARTRTTGGA